MPRTSPSARAWCRSPATPCRCSTRPASSPSTCRRAQHAGLFDVSHMGQAFLRRRRPRRRSRAALESAGPGRHPRPEARPAALHAAAQRGRRHPRRPDGDALGRSGRGRRAASSSSTPPRKDADFAHIAARLPAGVELQPRRRPRAARRCRGRRPPRCWRGIARRPPALPFMTARPRRASTASTCTSPAPATPARTATRSRSRPTTRVGALASRCSPTRGVKPIGLGARDSLRLEAGSASTATTSTRRPRRSRPASTWSIQKRRREEGGFPGAARIQRELADGPAARARRPPARGPRAGPRGHRDQRRATGATIGTRHLRRLRAERSARPIAMGYVAAALRRRPARTVMLDRPRQGARRPRSSPLPFVPHRYNR